MKYYKIQIQSLYGDRISSSANGKNIKNAEYYFDKIGKGEIVSGAPLFDYFYLESIDKREYWECQLNDIHDFIGEGSQIPGWLVSEKLKILLEKFIVTEPYFYYPSKLLYKGEKLNYYIFQFTGIKIFTETLSYINFNKSIFYDPIKKGNVMVGNSDEFISKYKKIYKANGYDNKLKNKKIVLKENLDFIPLGTFMSDNIISERLKQTIEAKGIKGFEFSEIEYEVKVQK